MSDESVQEIEVEDLDPLAEEIREQQIQNLPEVKSKALAAYDTQFMEEIGDKINALKAFKVQCLRLTTERDWVKFGENSYWLEASGAERLARVLGVDWGKPTRTLEQLPDGEYVWIVEGEMHCKALQAYIYEIGSCSSKNKFFTKNPNFDKERDYTDVLKKAMANWKTRAISSVAGLKNPPPDMFEAAGLSIDKMKGFQFKKKSEVEPTSEPINTSEPFLMSKGGETKDNRAELISVIDSISNLTGENINVICKRVSSFVGKDDGKEHSIYKVDYIKDKKDQWVNYALGQAKQELKELEEVKNAQ